LRLLERSNTITAAHTHKHTHTHTHIHTHTHTHIPAQERVSLPDSGREIEALRVAVGALGNSPGLRPYMERDRFGAVPPSASALGDVVAGQAQVGKRASVLTLFVSL
jgi:hypothetical protein